jgi:hypothetical protein
MSSAACARSSNSSSQSPNAERRSTAHEVLNTVMQMANPRSPGAEPSLLKSPRWRPGQHQIKTVYKRDAFQLFIAGTIMSSFVVSILEKEWDPDQVYYPSVWQVLDNVFNSIFLVELLMNIYSQQLLAFLTSSWNIFDSVVVVVGILSMAKVELGPARAIKVFRVFRLIPRVPSLNELFTNVLLSIPGVITAFILMLITMCVYAILAVEIFRPFGSDSMPYTTLERTGEGPSASLAEVSVSPYSTRGMSLGEEVRSPWKDDAQILSPDAF